ncbi:MAG: permease-like cell division protein FtsX [Patescibacteria group bacterium]
MKEKILRTLNRVTKSGINSFWRNKWVSTATVSVMVITLSLITSLFLLSVVAGSILTDLEQKVDISVYFKLNTTESEVLKVKSELEKISDVKSVEYVSRAEALAKFETEHENNPLIIKSLEELGDNPLEASLNIKAKLIDNYESIASFLESTRFSAMVDTVNYRQNQKVIEKLSSILSTVRNSGFIAILVLGFIAVLVTFNTIRLKIYSMREEIGVMRLVGASNWYIRGPFIIEGILHGMVSSLVTTIIFYPILVFVSPKISAFLSGIDIAAYFRNNFFQIFLLQTLVGVFLGVISSLIAMRRYLKI